MGNTSKHGHVREGPRFFFASLPFFTRHMADMGFSEHTARSYRKSLKLLLEFAATRGLKANTLRFQDCDRDFLYDYLEWLRDSKGCSPGTVRNRPPVRGSRSAVS